MPAPDTINPPSSDAILALVTERIGKMNGRASPGFDCVAASFIKNAVVVRPKPDGRGSERVNVLAPYFAQLFNLLYDKACIPACWKQVKLSPLYKKVPLLDPNNYRMLAVSGTMYRMYANVIRSLLIEWCVATGQIPATQYGFYPGRNTLQPMFILRHLQHAARTIKPNGPPRFHAAFTDFKQAYDTIPRDALWKHLRRTRMPAPLLSVIQDMYNSDEYVLKDGDKTARVHPTRGVKQGCPLSPLLFPFILTILTTLLRCIRGYHRNRGRARLTHVVCR
jgi:hypothetical protein